MNLVGGPAINCDGSNAARTVSGNAMPSRLDDTGAPSMTSWRLSNSPSARLSTFAASPTLDATSLSVIEVVLITLIRTHTASY